MDGRARLRRRMADADCRGVVLEHAGLSRAGCVGRARDYAAASFTTGSRAPRLRHPDRRPPRTVSERDLRSLFRWARLVCVRAENTAMPGLWPKRHAAAHADVEEAARVCRHLLAPRMPAVRARDRRFHDDRHHAKLPRPVVRNRWFCVALT